MNWVKATKEVLEEHPVDTATCRVLYIDWTEPVEEV